MSSVFANAPFKQTTLTCKVLSDDFDPDAEWGEDDNGNPIPPVAEMIDVTLTASVSPFKATQLQRLPGADAKLMPVRGSLIEPLTFPAGVVLGSVLTLTWEGRPHKLTITTLIPNALPKVKFGTYYEGELLPA